TANTSAITWGPTINQTQASSVTLNGYHSGPTLNYNTGHSLFAFHDFLIDGTLTKNSTSFDNYNVVLAAPTLQSSTAAVPPDWSTVIFESSARLSVTAAVNVGTVPNFWDFFAQSILSAVSGSTMTITQWNQFDAQPITTTAAGSTISIGTLRGLHVEDL